MNTHNKIPKANALGILFLCFLRGRVFVLMGCSFPYHRLMSVVFLPIQLNSATMPKLFS